MRGRNPSPSTVVQESASIGRHEMRWLVVVIVAILLFILADD